MHQRILVIFLSFCAQQGFADDPSRYSLKGTITADPRDSDSAGVAMLQDTHANKTVIVRMGQRVPGSNFILETVARKSVVLRMGQRTVTLYRNAWDGNRVNTASRERLERPPHTRQSWNERSATRSRVYGESSGLENGSNEGQFRAPPPPPPPILPLTEEGDFDAERYREDGDVDYSDDEVRNEGIPGVYPE